MEMEQKILLKELVQGKEFTEQLREQLSRLSSPEERQFLVEKILSCYEKALSLLNWENKNNMNPKLDSPLSNYCANSSPTGDFADKEFVDNSPKNVYKKRKNEPRWTAQVKVSSGSGVGGPLDDGYNWRKYGQKDILGANFPRNYYRCTHRHSQGCLATRQVQRADMDPTTFEVTYRGRHTCFQSSSPPIVNDKSKSNKSTFDQFEVEQHEEKPKPMPQSIVLKQLSFNFQELEPVADIDKFPSFSFPDEHNNIFMMENNLLGSFSPACTTSDYAVSPSQVCSFGLDYNERTPDHDSYPASANNSPLGEWDISIDFMDLEADFLLEEPELYY